MNAELKNLLIEAKELLKNEMTDISFNTWIKELEIDSFNDNNIVLVVNSDFKKEIIESRYYDLILNTFEYITKRKCSISIIIKDKDDLNEDEKNDTQYVTSFNNISESLNSSLNKKYTFDNFVVGNNNRFAHAAALAVAEAPATSYNPLFLYGGVGLGKTHLMHAIGNAILEKNKNAKILYVTSEKFTNQLINAIKDNKNEQFRNKYRNIDVLLIDDIQFIAGKERIQEEFFHTFNTLHENGKQIILSSDRPPKDIQLLEDRLKSRFEWGLIADISIPDYETRFAILRKKAGNENIIIEDDVLSNIAARVESNIRELEGALNRIIAISSLTNSPITMELVEKVLNDITSQKEKVISSDYIQEVVAKYFNISVKDLKGSKRSNDIAYPRQIAMFLCRDVAQMSFPKIGEDFGKRDHTTVMHGYSKIEKEINTNNNTKLIVESVKKIILNSN